MQKTPHKSIMRPRLDVGQIPIVNQSNYHYKLKHKFYKKVNSVFKAVRSINSTSVLSAVNQCLIYLDLCPFWHLFLQQFYFHQMQLQWELRIFQTYPTLDSHLHSVSIESFYISTLQIRKLVEISYKKDTNRHKTLQQLFHLKTISCPTVLILYFP